MFHRLQPILLCGIYSPNTRQHGRKVKFGTTAENARIMPLSAVNIGQITIRRRIIGCQETMARLSPTAMLCASIRWVSLKKTLKLKTSSSTRLASSMQSAEGRFLSAHQKYRLGKSSVPTWQSYSVRLQLIVMISKMRLTKSRSSRRRTAIWRPSWS